ncbi:sodium:proton antiporter [Bacteroidia bacterium]|nr:sodium:proton antiporter [Bacteroidia bacterium]
MTITTLMVIVFVIGYVCIALEHPIHINKTATALLLSTVLWTCMTQIIPSHELLAEDLVKSLGEVAEILFFLMGAMTIVEIVDIHGGFGLITDKIKETNKVKLLWIISFLTFFMSAVLDNLTTSIVMIALLRKLIDDKHDRWFFAGMVILAANAGGAWSPIGDVTTIMLWIGGKISAVTIIKNTFLPSAVSILVPLAVLSFSLKGAVSRPPLNDSSKSDDISMGNKVAITALGISALLFVPVFKTITHLPPYLGMLGGLGVLWIFVGLVHKRRVGGSKNQKYEITSILSRIDMSSILFFLGILMAVNALKVGGQLATLSTSLDTIPLEEPGKYYIITMIIGVFSSIIDNVPLVAGAIGMYSFPVDHYFWEFLAYAAGTGGSILIIGSAAGVAVMGMEKIDFIWYFKKVSWLALLGYLAGCAVYIVEHSFR